MSHESSARSIPPEDAEQDLQQRLNLATPQHTTRGFLFVATLRVVRELGQNEALVQSCLAASGEKSFAEFFNYPTSSLLRLLATAARALSARYGSFEESLRQIGFKAGEAYMETQIGQTARQHAGGDPQHFMTALQTLYWFLTQYGQPTVARTGPTSGVLVIQRTFMPPAYHEGGVWAIAKKLEMKLEDVRARKTGELSIELEFSW
ncbi:MAG TPA: DUF2378 family protein [Myxococcaceae bacterium]|nr:DUF2378 family protein [Myxococcaceae bacterium]